jgi:hypothetical protein
MSSDLLTRSRWLSAARVLTSGSSILMLRVCMREIIPLGSAYYQRRCDSNEGSNNGVNQEVKHLFHVYASNGAPVCSIIARRCGLQRRQQRVCVAFEVCNAGIYLLRYGEVVSVGGTVALVAVVKPCLRLSQ